MLDDYYSHHPTIHLIRPLVLTGTFHSDTRKIAHFLTGQTGLTLLDVDDVVAHRLGMSLVGLRHRDGQYAYLRDERTSLIRLVKKKPAGIIRGGKDPLTSEKVMEEVMRHGDILFIQRSLDYEPSKNSKRLSIRHYFNQVGVRLNRDVVERNARHIIRADNEHALSIAKSIVELLKRGLP